MVKAVWIIIIASVLQVSAGTNLSYSQSVKINIHLENVDLQEVIWIMKKQTEFNFFYSNDEIQEIKGLDIEMNNASAETILDFCLKGTGLTYEVVHKAIIIKKAENNGPDLKISVPLKVNVLQRKELSGTVKDARGLPLPGVTVIVKGTTTGTITDNNGQFILSVAPDAKTLIFSFVGMKSQEFPITGKTTFSVVLKEELVGLDDVVVVGYGVQKKASVVGAISQVSGKDIMKTGGVSSMSTALTGLLPGLVAIQTASGQPGSERAKLIIRSVSSWNGSDPLVLIDGIKRDMNDIDPNDVENISILKDASATAVYGVEGANGVILITTKRGLSGKTVLSFTGNVTMKTISRSPDILDSYQGLSLRNQAILSEMAMNPASWNYYMPQQVLEHYRLDDNPYVYPNINWKDYFVNGPAYSQKAGFTMRGGTDFVKYFGSMNYLHEDDVFTRPDNGWGYDPSFSYNRFNFRTNLDFKLTKSTSFTVNLAGFRGSQKAPGGSGSMWIYKFVSLGAPDIPVRYDDGIYGANPAYQNSSNPEVKYNVTGTMVSNTTNFTTDLALSQQLDFITQGLKADLQFSYDNTVGSSGPTINHSGTAGTNAAGISKYIDPVKYTAAQTDAERSAATIWNVGSGQFSPVPWLPALSSESYGGTFNKRMVYQARINYARDFGKHAVSGLAVFKRQQGANAEAWPDYREDWVGRATYGFDNRYFFEANGAYNGSEKFGPGYRFGFFPSLSMGWTFSNEKYIIKNAPFLSLGKIRYSNGKVGSDQGIARWLYTDAWATGTGFTGSGPYEYGSPFVSTNASYSPYYQSVIANPSARWETSHKQNIGLETGLFDNMVVLNIDHYWEKRSGIFMSGNQRTAVLSWFGAAPVAANLGETEGKGWEVELKLNKTTGKGLHYYINTNWAYNNDKVIYREDAKLLADYLKNEGFVIGQTKTRLNNGFYNSWDDIYTSVLDGNTTKFIPGQFKQIDFNADGKIDNYDAAPYGFANRPQGSYSTTLGFDYKGFSAMVQFYGVYNVTRTVDMHEFSSAAPANYWTSTQSFHRDNSWTPERAVNGTADYAILSYRVQTANTGDYIYKDASYLRLKTAEIAYTLDKSLLSRIGVSKMRVFLNGNNLIFWSKLPDDAEDYNTTSSLGSGYPTLKRYNLGVEITF